MYSEGFPPPFELMVQNHPRRKRYVTANQNPLSANPCALAYAASWMNQLSTGLPYVLARYHCRTLSYSPVPQLSGHPLTPHDRSVILGIQLQPRRLKWFVTLLDFFYVWRHAVPVWYQLEVKISPAAQCVVWIPLVPVCPLALEPSLIMMSIFVPL
ncbi:hypothetical protein C8R41DRAFT_899572 [Lentinula lateritia]|uniref:Uncharacterized protein n=1 Tax=Lentinula lateritia TaxID=40482 RepID=A0ABQ8VX15_9AGAR|nr:hypothetical protein C8R41DRAFT_899572 [Lentinula lateritia]